MEQVYKKADNLSEIRSEKIVCRFHYSVVREGEEDRKTGKMFILDASKDLRIVLVASSSPT